MQITAKHVSVANEQNLHFSLEDLEPSALEKHLRKVAESLSYHFAVLDGRGVRDATELLWRLATVYVFPGMKDGTLRHPNWDSTRDWLSDLMWITGWPPGSRGVRGFLLYYRNPNSLFRADPVAFGLFLEAIVDATAAHTSQGIAMHLVAVPISGQLETFLTLTRSYSRVCPTCLYGRLASDQAAE